MAGGSVVFVSRNGGMVVVQHENGFTVVELLGAEGEIERGNQLSGDWLALGGETVFKDGEPFDAFLQGCWGSAQGAISTAQRIGGG